MQYQTADISYSMDLLLDTVCSLHMECEDNPSLFTDMEAKTIYELVVVLSNAFDEYNGDSTDE